MSIGWKMLLFFAMASFFAWPLLFAGIGTRREVRRRRESEHTRASGTIVEYIAVTVPPGRNAGSAGWKPVVEFTAEGQAHRLEYANTMDRDRFPVGTAVDVFYDVSDPARFHLEADPVFVSPGSGAIKIALIWIFASAALTVALAVFVGGAELDLRRLFRHR